MKEPTRSALPSISLSHFELFVSDVECMAEFYTRYLGFVITDRGAGAEGMVFLSRNPQEHHQLVLNPRQFDIAIESPVDHIAFRVASLQQLRRFYESLRGSPAELKTVSHGTTWSIYFRDPEDNRLELFTDTPWHVNQPCRFEVDFALADAELSDFTDQQIKHLPGYRELSAWHWQHVEAIGTDTSN
jgi:catechol 2,3-dioxygenase